MPLFSRRILYSASVVSPLPMTRKRTSATSRNPLQTSSDTSGGVSFRPRSDFWTEVGKMHEAELSRPTTTSATTTPAASILKVCAAGLDVHKSSLHGTLRLMLSLLSLLGPLRTTARTCENTTAHQLCSRIRCLISGLSREHAFP